MADYDRLAPGLLRPEHRQGLLRRVSDRRQKRNIERQLEAERLLEWRRLAPSGSPLWVLPDVDLEETINRLAASSRARTVELTYYIAEFDRRQQRRLNERLADANRHMMVLTRAVLALTGILVLLTIASTIAIAT
jgi:hypothetical protein